MLLSQSAGSPVIQLRQVREVLRRYCQGLTAQNVQIHSIKALAEKGIGWTAIEKPIAEVMAIYLPPAVEEFDSPGRNFGHYKVLATHQAAHFEFGTFDFSFQKSSALFANVRQEIIASNGGEAEGQSDFQRFFDVFPDRKLATDIFMVVEDTRVDYLLKQEYRGIRGDFNLAQRNALGKRPEITTLPTREALMEILVQLSIENWGFYPVPPGQSGKISSAVAILRRMRSRRATVEDAAEATLRIYGLLSDADNAFDKSRSPQNWDSSNPLDSSYPPEDDLGNLLSGLKGQPGGSCSGRSNGRSQDERPYRSPGDVDYRAGMTPEMGQALRSRRAQAEDTRRRDNHEQSAQSPDEANFKTGEAGTEDSTDASVVTSPQDALQGDLGKAAEGVKPPEQRPVIHMTYPSKSMLQAPVRDGTSFLYDEWDQHEGQYKRQWCRLRQRPVDEGSAEFYLNTVKNHVGLVASVRREFERLRSDRFKKVRQLQDGEEFDLDSVVEAVVEKRAGVTPNDKLYWRKNKVERDVCVLFLLDMSASTYESVSGGYRLGRPGISDDGEPSKRIIDVEKESMVILVEALQAIGDAYGIYGFSGHGKDNVEFYIIKDMAEDLTTKVKKRIEKIAPAQETRMGTAIRHAISILGEQEYKTKLLLLLSDGRPQDHDYGAHHFRDADGPGMYAGGMPFGPDDRSYDRFMKEYAVFDTRMALLEARQRNIVTFCLTVDKRGHDYLKAMCGDIGYEVIDDIVTLPKRLPHLYRRLTT